MTSGPARRLDVIDGAVLVVSTMVGVGIFTTPGVIASMVPGPGSFLLVWVVGGILSLCGALAYAELAAAYPRSGGEYVYLRRAFGPLAGFLSGWTSFVAGFSGAIAAGAVGLATYLDRLVPGAGSTEPFLEGPFGAATSPRTLVALSVVVLLTLVHARGLSWGRPVQNALGLVSVATIVWLVLLGAVLMRGAGVSIRPEGPAAGGSQPLVALVLVMFTFSGWNAATYVTGEMRRPGRDVRPALLVGTAVVLVLYLALNLVYVRGLGFGGLRSTLSAADDVAGVIIGPSGAALVAVTVVVALLGSVSAMILTGPRIYCAMAQDGVLPRRFGRLTGDSGVPAFATLVQGAWTSVLVLTGTFEAILTYTGFAVVLFATAAVASLFVLRRRDGPAGPGRPWGHPVTPLLFVGVGLAMTVQSIRHAPGPSLLGLAVIAAGVPFFRLGSRRAEETALDVSSSYSTEESSS